MTKKILGLQPPIKLPFDWAMKESRLLIEESLKIRSSSFYCSALCDRMLLKFIETGEVGQKYPKLFDESIQGIPWHIIYHVSKGNLIRAREYWNQLHQSSPAIYGAFLVIESDPRRAEIFGMAVTKLEVPDESAIDRFRKDPDLPRSLSKRLIYILKKSEGPVPKEDLIEILWECEFHPGDIPKFYKLARELLRP